MGGYQKMLYAINRLDLGSKRTLGYELFDGKQYLEMTGKQIMDSIKSGEIICGLKISEGGKSLELDREKFFTTNMMIHCHIDQYKPIIQGISAANIMYVIIDAYKENNEMVYCAISSRYERTSFNKSEVKMLLNMGLITGGIKQLGNGKLELAPPIKNRLKDTAIESEEE